MDTNGAVSKELTIDVSRGRITGDLEIPADASGIVVFAHGSGSSRFSSRNRFVAGELRKRGLGTFLLDLLTEEEEAIDRYTREYRFDIELLAGRLVTAIRTIADMEDMPALPIGSFGSSTGAAAALIAAARLGPLMSAVVSRGGRPDLAGDALASVISPVLLIVGGLDTEVIGLNRGAFERLTSEKKLVIVQGATHLFEEPGTLEKVADLAGEWFSDHFRPEREANDPQREAGQRSQSAR
jgi:putative phosphoribosyl transferase